MDREDRKYGLYLRILKEELVPAMGCTEPIALAYGAAKAREVLGALPDRIEISVCGNIIKNVKSVIVPNTGGLKGIKAAVAAGVVAGDAKAMLEVLSKVSEADKAAITAYMDRTDIRVESSKDPEKFYFEISCYLGTSSVRLVIKGYHTNIVLIEKDGETVYSSGVTQTNDFGLTDRSVLSVAEIVDFADSVQIDEIRDVIERQIEFNTRISEEGLKKPWGARVGHVLLTSFANDVRTRARAAAAAGSDARMSGCELPVIIVSGSGNQGMTASLPVIEYAKEYRKSKEELYKALVVSNLVTIHQKTGIGRLSAFCGAVSAGCGAGAGIAYLLDGSYEAVAHTVVNALAIVSGIVCDGAKPSCAGKIASAVDAAILGYCMYKEGYEFKSGDGIVTKGVDNTIENVGRMAREGMRETDEEILKIMVEEKDAKV